MLVGHIRTAHRYPVKSMAGETLHETDVSLEGVVGDRAYALRDEVEGELRSARRWPRLMQCSARYRSEPTRAHEPPAIIVLPDGSEVHTDDPAVSQQLSAWLGQPVKLFPRVPASDKAHYKRLATGASLATAVAGRSSALKRFVSKLSTLGPSAQELRREFGRADDEPLPDMSHFPAEIFAYTSPPGTYFDAYPIHVLTTASLDAMRALYPAGDWDARRFRANFVVETVPELSGLLEASWPGRTLRIGEVELLCIAPAPRCSMIAQAQPGVVKDPTILRTVVQKADQNFGIYATVKRAGRVASGDAVTLV